MSTQPNPPGDNSLSVRINRWTLGWSRHWLRILLTLIGLYVALPFAAPTLMHFGLTGPAQLLYTVYSPMCHQLAFRSWFLYGPQPAYPRAAANVPGLQPFENFAADVNQGSSQPVNLDSWTQEMFLAARQFVGDERMGYKVAVCERDVSIYGALFLGGLIYAIPVVRRHLRPVPIWLYLLLGIAPIAIDGFSQLFSYPPFNLWPVRETSPFFRALTGALFGFMNAWLAFPYLEASARDMVRELEGKFERRRQREAGAKS
jgi:uncharacterized membrane protein